MSALKAPENANRESQNYVPRSALRDSRCLSEYQRVSLVRLQRPANHLRETGAPYDFGGKNDALSFENSYLWDNNV